MMSTNPAQLAFSPVACEAQCQRNAERDIGKGI